MRRYEKEEGGAIEEGSQIEGNMIKREEKEKRRNETEGEHGRKKKGKRMKS